MNEQEAIACLKQGRIDGLAVLVETYQQQAVYAACLITRDRALAEDVVQAAFLRVYERIEQFDAQRPFRPWFFQIVINAAIKATTRHSTLSLDDSSVSSSAAYQHAFHDPALDPERLFEYGETREAVSAALAKLSPIQRAVIVQHYYLDLQLDEIATNLNCPPGTVKSRLHTARERLRGLLQPFISLHI